MDRFLISAGQRLLPAVLHHPKGPDADTLLVICHGFHGSMDGGGRAVELAERVSGLGASVLRFAFTPTEKLSLQLTELRAVINYCRHHIGKRIFILGRSMGGSCALAFTAEARDVAGLCLWATPCNLCETFRLSLGEGYDLLRTGKPFEANDEYGKLMLTPDFIEDFSNFNLLASLRQIRVPVLIIHGSSDEVVPLRQAKLAYAVANEPKSFVVIEGGDHQLHDDGASAAVIHWLADWFK